MSQASSDYYLRNRAHRTPQRSSNVTPSPDLSFLDSPWYKDNDEASCLLKQRRMQYLREMEDSEFAGPEYEEASAWKLPAAKESFADPLKRYSVEFTVFAIVIIFLFEIPLRLPFLLYFFFSISSLHVAFTPGSLSSKHASDPQPEALYRGNPYAQEQQAPIPGTLLHIPPPAARIAIFNPATWFPLPVDRTIAHTNFKEAKYQPRRTWWEALSNTLCSLYKSWGGFLLKTLLFQLQWRLFVLIVRFLHAAWNHTAHEWQLPDTCAGLRELLMPNLWTVVYSHPVKFWIHFAWMYCIGIATGFYIMFFLSIDAVILVGKILWLAGCVSARWMWEAVVQGVRRPGAYVGEMGSDAFDTYGQDMHPMHSMRTVYAASANT